ncbi:MAG: (E)-4-hydroxy-3-methylbut-2-enyl-diphosphate synthase, partial [Oscillospiraceae bacterium]|nr:(E)-4-hydroxy-3-methylbut-2-enyl-diphosphate synthase [Oscillospiraceae bacterium]
MKKTVKVGGLTLGNGKIYVQSMLNVPAENILDSVKQAQELESAGCEIIRAAVPRIEDAALISALKDAVSVPIVADIHFDYRIALACAEAGVDKIRINPGNIGGAEKVKAVADACRKRGIPIRIGVNSGSLERELLKKYGSPTPEALVESALNHVKLLNDCDFDDIVISIKSSNVRLMIAAYRLLARQTDYPLHLGVTEAGTERMGMLKSAVGIGSLLCDGIGDTIRVSLTAAPVKEGYAARDILDRYVQNAWHGSAEVEYNTVHAWHHYLACNVSYDFALYDRY